MAAQSFAIVPPSNCHPLPLSRTQRPPFLHATHFSLSLRCLPKVVASQGIAGGPFQPARAHSFGSWLWNGHSIEKCASSSLIPHSSTGNASSVRWLVLLLYRALVVGGIGLSLGQTAAVHAAPAVSEVIIDEASGVKQKAAEKDFQKAEEKKTASSLGDDFWKGLDLARGSDELILKKVLDSDPTNLPALECLAKTLSEDDDFSRALMVIEKLEALQPNELEWKYMKAEAYDLDGKSKVAKKMFEDILKVEPFSSRALQGLVVAMDQLDEGDSALKLLEETWNKAKEDNNHEEARNFGMLIGQIHTFKGRMQEALQHYNKMIEEDPSDFRPYLCQGIIYSVLGELDMADKSFQTFENLCPKDLSDREFFDGLKSRARKEGQRIYDFKQKQKAKTGKKGEKKKS